MSYSIEILIFGNGERYPILVDESGMPHPHVTLWVTCNLRGTGRAESTIINKLSHIKRLLGWEVIQDKDLFSDFRAGRFLKLHEVESLSLFVSTRKINKRVDQKGNRNKMHLLGKANIKQENLLTSSSSHKYNTITSITEYLLFLAQLATQYSSSPKTNEEIQNMKKLLQAARPKSKGYEVNLNRSTTIPNSLVRDFMGIAHYGNAQNPFKVEAVRFRNHLMFRILENLGIRRGELLSLKLTNMILHGSEKSVLITRSHDDPFDPRRKQPVTKTRERRLAISSELANEIEFYIKNYRSKHIKSRKHPYLFVSHKAGTSQGEPISGSSFDNTILPLMKKVDSRFRVIYPHFFRHEWNERFSQQIDRHNASHELTEQISPDQEAKMRKHQMGHAREESSRVYNQRHISKRANEVSLKEQEELQNSRMGHNE